MQRREALRNFALLAGGGLLSGTTISILNSCNLSAPKSNGQLFSDEEQMIITELADVIIPATSSPGAKAAGVGEFITMMLNDCYPEDVQKDFAAGLEGFSASVKKQYSKDFLSLSSQDKIAAVTQLSNKTIADQKAGDKDPNAKKSKHFFPIARDLTILGYFTSEIGATQAMAYVAVPGRYDGSADMKPGQKAWAPDSGWGTDNALKS
ncbi:MAG: gluconate 2-dehydrogenase subunit 3 family protein [Arachidicoccus sp.]|nr:gluconate 2-dehydrogenase subunit 3 family protein [Arachidicoccus sp.]